MKLNVESSDWFTKPEMMGHIWAKEMVEYVKVWYKKNVKTKEQKKLVDFCLSLNSTDWHYWQMSLTKKSLSQLQYVLRRLGKESYVNLLGHLWTTSGCLKDELHWWLELKSYESQHQNCYFLNFYYPAYRGLGMSLEDCRERFNKYHTKLKNKHPEILS